LQLCWTTQRFVPDSFKLRTARFEHADRRFAELSYIDHGIKLCPLFVDLGDRARGGVQKCSKTVCTDIQWETSSHQHPQIRQFQARACNTLPSGRWRARRRIDTGHAGRLYGRERARGHVQPRCRGGGGVGRGKRCRLRHRSGGGPPASRGAHGRGRHSAAQRTCARRPGWPTRRTGGRVGLITARRGACNRTARWRQQPPTRRRNRKRRAGTITRGSSWARQAPEVAARGHRA